MVVISVGLLGIAGLIMTNLKNNQSAYARGQATILANDIIDRMRANRTLADAGAYAIKMTESASTNTNAVVKSDIAQWRAALAAAMQGGTGSIALNANGHVVVTIQWDDSRGSAGGGMVGLSAQQFVEETRL
jgi:type IV pilus assembly protein PilV